MIKSIAELEQEGMLNCANHLRKELRQDLKETKRINLQEIYQSNLGN